MTDFSLECSAFHRFLEREDQKQKRRYKSGGTAPHSKGRPNMPNPERLLSTLSQAVRAFRATSGRTGHVIRLPARAEVLVAGDMHGSVENFRLLLKVADLSKHPTRHLILQEV